MSDRFIQGYKKNVVRPAFIIVVATMIAVILLPLITDIPIVYINLLPAVSWIVFIIWLYFYKRKLKKLESGD